MPVSISIWKDAAARGPFEDAARVARPESADGRSYRRTVAARAGMKTRIGRVMPAARSWAPSSIVATP